MSNTAYQRSSKDLEKAGLNRVLALGGPASSPAGAKPNVINPTAGMANSAKNALLLQKQADFIDNQSWQAAASAKANDSQATLTHDQAQEVRDRTEFQNEERAFWRANPDLWSLNMANNPASLAATTAKGVLGLLRKPPKIDPGKIGRQIDKATTGIFRLKK